MPKNTAFSVRDCVRITTSCEMANIRSADRTTKKPGICVPEQCYYLKIMLCARSKNEKNEAANPLPNIIYERLPPRLYSRLATIATYIVT